MYTLGSFFLSKKVQNISQNDAKNMKTFSQGLDLLKNLTKNIKSFFRAFLKKFHAYCVTHLLLHRNESKKLDASGARRGNLEWN